MTEQKTFVEEFLEQNIRTNLNDSVVLHNISKDDFTFEYDEFKVAAWGDSMLPPDEYTVKAGEAKQFPKFLAFYWWIRLAKKMAYELYGDTWVSVPSKWLEFADKILYLPWKEVKQPDPIAEAKEEIKEEVKEEPKEEVKEEPDDEYTWVAYTDLVRMAKEKWVYVLNMKKVEILEALRQSS